MQKRDLGVPLVASSGFILPIEAKWWKRFCDQNREGKTLHVYVRKGNVGPKDARLIFFYVTHPFKEIRGFAEFVDRIIGDADELWKDHGSETCLRSYEEFKNLMRGRRKATFILFRNLHELSKPVSFETISKVLGIRRMSRMGKYVTREESLDLI